MKKTISALVPYTLSSVALFLLSSCSTPQSVTTDNTWRIVSRPEKLGYSSAKLAEAKQYAQDVNTAAVVIVVDGKILYEWGDVDKKFNTHSIRKSFLSALYGRYVRDGVIDVDRTLGEIGIDDEPPLSDEEKKATIRDCLKARSGVYHTALYESQTMKDLKPPRHSMRAGTHWYYNNWDFNVLGTIFEKYTGKRIFEAIEEEIAKPIGMEDFSAEDGSYVTGDESIHPAYPFRITARDLARFGVLMLSKGRWNGKQIIPRDWVEESTSYYSDATLYGCDGYGYMWWVSKANNKYPHLPNVDLPEGTYSARGSGGHYLIVIPAYDMVVVHRVNTDIRGNKVAKSKVGTLMNMILQARM
jgi:CubicO group peptidase (beta-lactamase class C family)